MPRRRVRRALANVGWVALGVAAAGCLDPLVEDPGIKDSPDEAIPIPVSPGVAPAGSGLGNMSAAPSSEGINAVVPSSSAAATATSTSATTGAAGATGGATGTTSPAHSASASEPTVVTPDGEETSNVDPGAGGQLDAGALDEPDADAGPDGSASDENHTATASSSSSG